MDEPAASLLEYEFGRLLEHEDAEERRTHLEQLRKTTPGLADELQELLAIQAADEFFLDRLADEVAAGALEELERVATPARLRIGPFELGEVLGRGGMGAVYRARRVDDEFEQEVAIKILHLDMDSPSARRRFRRERQLLARLKHPHIARLFDGGVTAEDRPYLVMEMVEGLPLDRWCEEHGLELHQRLELFLQVVDAVAYLQQNLIVHRDLKPSNILVDQQGRVKLLDFGIAKLIGDDHEDQTRTVERILTPGFAAPEQSAGETATTAVDVYSLGVVLRQLLVGTGSPPGDSPGILPPDLERICAMATREEPEHRYATAADLGRDLRRFLEGRPVHATPPTWRYVLGKALQRHRKAVAVGALVLSLVAVFTVRETRLRTAAETARQEAQVEAAKTRAVSDFLTELLASPDPWGDRGRQVTVVDILDVAAARLDGTEDSGAESLADNRFAQAPLVEAAIRLTLGRAYTSLEQTDSATTQLERALSLRRAHGAPIGDRSEALEAVAANLYKARQFKEAEALFSEIFKERRERFGEEHPRTLASMHQMASAAFWRGDLERVLELDRRTLEIRQRTLGAEHPDSIQSLNGLGTTLFRLSRLAEAAELFEQSYEAQIRQLGHRHPDTQMAATNLGASWLELGRYREAESLLGESLEIQREVFGEGSSQVAFTLQNQGLTLAKLGRFEEALPLLKDSLRLRRALPGTELLRLSSESQIADVLADLGHLEAAEARYRTTLARLRELVAEDPAAQSEMWRTQTRLAALELRTGRREAARKQLEPTIVDAVETLGEDDPAVIAAHIVASRLHRLQGNLAVAHEMGLKALTSAEKRRPLDLPQTLEARIEVAATLIELQRTQEARNLLEPILQVLRERKGGEHPETLSVRGLLNRTQ